MYQKTTHKGPAEAKTKFCCICLYKVASYVCVEHFRKPNVNVSVIVYDEFVKEWSMLIGVLKYMYT